MSDLGFLRPQERRTVGLALFAIACAAAGATGATFVGEARGASVDVHRIAAIETQLAKLDKNMGRIMDRLAIPEEPELPRVRISGPRP